MLAPVSFPTTHVYPSLTGRPVSADRVRLLADSIKAVGLKSPITVKACQKIRDGRPADAFEIVAGRHRYEAALLLQWSEIPAFLMEGDADDFDLWEIDENFARAELSDAQRADHHARREAILIRKGVVRPQGGDRKSNGQNGHLKSYAEHASEGMGVSDRTVRRDLRRGKDIAPDVLADVAGTDLDKGTVLDELAKTPRDEQRAALTRMQAEPKRSAVRPAPDPLNDPEAHEKQLSALMAAWNRAAAVVRQEFLLRIEEPVFDNTDCALEKGRGR